MVKLDLVFQFQGIYRDFKLLSCLPGLRLLTLARSWIMKKYQWGFNSVCHITIIFILFMFNISSAHAVPSFARQTGMDCAACHTQFPELTPYGREFKRLGYTWGKRKLIPFAAMAQISMTHVANSHDNAGQKLVWRQNDLQFDVLSLFAAGKLTDHAGMFIQYTYDNNGGQNNNGTIIHHAALDNTDLRVTTGNIQLFGKDLVLGLNLNNNPSVQDVWNTTPAWGFPYNGSNVPHPEPSYATMIDGGLGQLVAGLGGYLWWDRHLYVGLSFYGNANHIYRVLSAGSSWTDVPIDGRKNPYWRLAWNEDWGANSLMIGTYGMRVDVYPDNLNQYGSTDRYTDTALDAQYQYISDPGIYSFQTTLIHEKQDLSASYNLGNSQNSSDKLNTFKVKMSYLYDRKYGATLGYFTTWGSKDTTLYADSINGRPGNTSYIVELDYDPWTNVRFAFQYTGYTKWDGATHNIDGIGRSPQDNNTLFLNSWFAF